MPVVRIASFRVEPIALQRWCRSREARPCCLALDDAVFVVQGAEGEWNTVLTQRGRRLAPALRTSRLRWVRSV